MNRQEVSSSSDSGDLTSAMFHILLALAESERHGYAIMKEVETRTNGDVELGPGTLYRSIKQLVAGGLIVEVESEQSADRQRRTYRLTEDGNRRAKKEAERLKGLVQWAENAQLLEGTQT